MARTIRILPSNYKSVVQPRTVEEHHAALCNELQYLREENKRLRSLITFKDGVLLYAARFFEDLLRSNEEQSIDFVKRLISQLKGAADRQQGGLE